MRHDEFRLDEVWALQRRYLLQPVRLCYNDIKLCYFTWARMYCIFLIDSLHDAANSPCYFLYRFLDSFILSVRTAILFFHRSACQKADCSQHKKMCHTHNRFPAFPLSTVVADWLRENLLAIVKETQLVANRLGLSRQDVVLNRILNPVHSYGIRGRMCH